MKVVILAGGLGTRLMEETEARPKPMVEIGGKPILWHIMKIYEAYGYNDFVLCLGYKAQSIKEYFLNYYLYNSDVTIELEKNKVEVHFSNAESCKFNPISTAQYPTAAIRPQYSVLDKSNINERFNVDIPYWKDSLRICLIKIKSEQKLMKF